MEEENYKEFFEQIKEFKEEQNKQKQRGLNDYNMVNVVRKATHEVGMHSNIIYSLINPEGLHYQEDLFLQKFIKIVLKLDDFGEVYEVQAEESTSENKRIDFTIKSSNYYIGIEMKVNHHDSSHQLFDYYEDLKTKAKNNNISEKNVRIFYLTKNGKEVSTISLKGRADKQDMQEENYTRISFNKHILKWIDECQEEVRNITNLNEALENYKTIVKKITNQYKGKVMTLMDYIKNLNQTKQKEYISILNDINNDWKSTKDKLKKEFFTNTLVSYLENNLQDDWKIKIDGKLNDINKRYKVNIQIYKEDDWDIIYWLRFEQNDMNSLYWAIAKKSDIDISVINEKIKLIGLKDGHAQTTTSVLWKKSNYDLEDNLYLLLNKEDKSNQLLKGIYEEFNMVMNMLKNDYEYSIDEMNKVIKNDRKN